ncbi:MAG: hypothetical protein QOH63_2048 [Acidobacteriota bacterium]|jgi:hypothetical protein|nr:hypothetical protein [Acidobacteriota bacterium]
MRRIVGIIIFALGILFLVAGLTKLVHGVTGISIFAIFIGVVVFGLSFIPQPEPGPEAPPPLPPADRVTGVFYEPERIFKNLRHYPRWLAAFLVLVVFSLTYQIAFTQRVTPERIAGEMADKIIEGGWLQNSPMSPEEFKRMRVEEAKAPVGRITGALGLVGGTLVFMLVLAGLYLLGVLAFGGRINFWQSLSVATYGSLPPVVISTILSLILLYVKSPEDIDTARGARGLARADLGLLFTPAQHPLLFVIGSFIGIFSIYGWWVTVSGLHNTATKLSKASAWTIALLLWLLGLAIALLLSAIFPSFVQ